jgi:hypothetical protein
MEWEDFVIFTKESDAIEYSILKPNIRIEIFAADPNDSSKGFIPTYNFYKNGILYMS